MVKTLHFQCQGHGFNPWSARELRSHILCSMPLKKGMEKKSLHSEDAGKLYSLHKWFRRMRWRHVYWRNLFCELEGHLPGGLVGAESLLCVDLRPRPPLYKWGQSTRSGEYTKAQVKGRKEFQAQIEHSLFFSKMAQQVHGNSKHQREMQTEIHRHDLRACSLTVKSNKPRELSPFLPGDPA